jgi:hypothetical protein
VSKRLVLSKQLLAVEASVDDEQIAEMVLAIVTRPKSSGRAALEACQIKFDELLAAADPDDRDRLRNEYLRLVARANHRLIAETIYMYSGTEQEAAKASARRAREAKYPKSKRLQAVNAVLALKRGNLSMSRNSAVRNVSKSLGIPPRTLDRWVAPTWP